MMKGFDDLINDQTKKVKSNKTYYVRRMKDEDSNAAPMSSSYSEPVKKQ